MNFLFFLPNIDFEKSDNDFHLLCGYCVTNIDSTDLTLD